MIKYIKSNFGKFKLNTDTLDVSEVKGCWIGHIDIIDEDGEYNFENKTYPVKRGDLVITVRLYGINEFVVITHDDMVIEYLNKPIEEDNILPETIDNCKPPLEKY